MAQNQNSRFLLGLANSIIGGVKSRQDEEKALADQLMGLIMKAQIESAMKSQLQQSGMENLRELSGNSDYDIGYKMDDEGSILPTASPVNADDLLKRKTAERKLNEMSGGATVSDIQDRSNIRQPSKDTNLPPQYLTDYEYRYDDDTGMSTQVPKRVENPEYKSIIKARESLDEYTSDASQALVAVDKIENYARKLGDFKTGYLNQAKAKVSTGIATFGKEENITEYLGVVSQELIPLARKIMEEKGPITEFDVKRVEKGLGDLTTPLKTKIKLLRELRMKVRRAIDNKADVARISKSELHRKYPTLIKMLAGKKQMVGDYARNPTPSSVNNWEVDPTVWEEVNANSN